MKQLHLREQNRLKKNIITRTKPWKKYTYPKTDEHKTYKEFARNVCMYVNVRISPASSSSGIVCFIINVLLIIFYIYYRYQLGVSRSYFGLFTHGMQ